MTGAAAAQTYGSGFSGQVPEMPRRPAEVMLTPADARPVPPPAPRAPAVKPTTPPSSEQAVVPALATAVPTRWTRTMAPATVEETRTVVAVRGEETRTVTVARADEAPAPKPLPAAPRPLPAVPPYTLTANDLTGCGPAGGFGCCDGCGPPGRSWVGVEWLYWITSGQPLPTVVTTAPVGTPRAVAGAFGQPTTTTLYGGSRVNNDFRNGFRVYAGTWLNDDQTMGVEGDFFFLGSSRQGFAAGSDGSTIITRPFVNAVTGIPDVELVSFPGVLAGSTSVDAKSSFLGAGINGLFNVWCDPCARVDLLVGYRYLNLVDQLTFRESLTALAGQTMVPAGTTFLIEDKFTTRNNFHGGLLGLSGEWRMGNFFVGGRAAVSLGVNRQTTNIDGQTIITLPGAAPQVFAGGLYTQPSNIGHYERSVFAVAPEFGIRVGAQVTEFARAYVGYNFIYLSNVLRAGDQVDQRVNPNFLPPRGAVVPGPALPTFSPNTTDFWAQGVSAGVELRF
jgi:hypothetical protein